MMLMRACWMVRLPLKSACVLFSLWQSPFQWAAVKSALNAHKNKWQKETDRFRPERSDEYHEVSLHTELCVDLVHVLRFRLATFWSLTDTVGCTSVVLLLLPLLIFRCFCVSHFPNGYRTKSVDDSADGLMRLKCFRIISSLSSSSPQRFHHCAKSHFIFNVRGFDFYDSRTLDGARTWDTLSRGWKTKRLCMYLCAFLSFFRLLYLLSDPIM